RVPPGDRATVETDPWWPVNRRTSLPVFVSNCRAVPSLLATNRLAPSPDRAIRDRDPPAGISTRRNSSPALSYSSTGPPPYSASREPSADTASRVQGFFTSNCPASRPPLARQR